MKFPLIADNSTDAWTKSVKVNNWIRKFYFADFPVKLSIEKTSKSIILKLHEKKLSHSKFLSDFFVWVVQGVLYSYLWLRKNGIEIDFRGMVVRQHTANVSRGLKDKLDRRVRVELDLGRKAKSLFPTNIDAKAWGDWSKGVPEFESNDVLWQEKFLAMPDEVFDLAKKMNVLHTALAEYGIHLRTHTSVMKKLDGTLGLINGSLDEKQTKLRV